MEGASIPYEATSTMRTPLPTSHSILRRLSERFVLLLVTLIVMHAWYIAGIVPTCRVTSGSMAPALVGLHRSVECEDCGYPFRCGSDAQPVSPHAVCPNCGYAANDLESQLDTSGDGMLIQKSIFRMRPPRRWEVVAFRQPQETKRIQVKRVVGLPGESVRIRDGDVYIDGKIQRKTLSQQRAMAIPVHDANFQPTGEPAPPPRWQGQGPDSRWGSAGAVFAHPEEDDEQIDWLEYRHWRRLVRGDGSGKTEVLETPITDLCGYDQTRPRREEEISLVTDLMLSLKLLDWSGEGRLIVRASDGSEEFRIEIEPGTGSWAVSQNGRPVASDTRKPAGRKKGLRIEVSLFDQEFLLAFDGKPVVGWPYVPSQPRQPTSRPLAIGTKGLQVKIGDLRVYRDVYYTRPVGIRARWGVDQPVQPADDEYFVLGDNSPVSEDSRTWSQPGVPAKLLVGKPLVVHFPCRLVYWGESVFQVPDLGRIRYIR